MFGGQTPGILLRRFASRDFAGEFTQKILRPHVLKPAKQGIDKHNRPSAFLRNTPAGICSTRE